MTCLVGAYFVWLVLPGSHHSTVVDGWSVDALELLAGYLCLRRAFVVKKESKVAAVLASSIILWALGDLVTTIESLGGSTPSTPSPADAFYLAFYPCAYAGIVLRFRTEARSLRVTDWLDGIASGTGAAAICAMFAFHGLVASTGGSALATATNVAYPVGDLLLLAFVVTATVMMSHAERRSWFILAAGLACNVVGDTFNLFGSSVGSSSVGVICNAIAWPLSTLLISASVWAGGNASTRSLEAKPSSAVPPAVGATAGLSILFAGSFHRPGPVTLALATVTLVLVGTRATVSNRQLRKITHERRRQSITDALTGLGNRRLLFEVLDNYFGEESESGGVRGEMAFLFIDLNHFKEVNDTFGHPAGDAVLRQLGQRLVACLRSEDLLVRLGGDEFAAVVMDTDGAEAARVADRLCASLTEPFMIDAIKTRVGASIGIALTPSDAVDSAGLVTCADMAMYRAKLGGQPYARYDRQLDDGTNRLRLAEDLERALTGNQFVLHYQPQLELSSGEIKAVEALVRWNHPELGMVPPLQFLPLAEEAGLMGRLTEWVLGEALAECAGWRRSNPEVLVAVNISPTSLLDSSFVTLVGRLLERNEVPADALVLEITETTVISDFERSRLVIAELRSLGVTVSVDDFGAGFTSLAHLTSLAVRELKLDRVFVTRLTGDDPARDIQLVRGTIELAHALGLRVVAEGVEEEATLRLLADMKCDLAQGFLISRPKPPAELAIGSRNEEQPALLG